jgi:hypothetical protein
VLLLLQPFFQRKLKLLNLIKVEMRFAESTPFSAAPSFGFGARVRSAIFRIAPPLYGLVCPYQV